MDELKACTDYQYEYRDSCLMCFSETWFKSTDSPHTSEIEGFACERMDRTLDSNKLTGGGVCAYVNKRWCTDIKVKHTVCSPDIELLTISLCPFYLPREFNQIFITDVYNWYLEISIIVNLSPPFHTTINMWTFLQGEIGHWMLWQRCRWL